MASNRPLAWFVLLPLLCGVAPAQAESRPGAQGPGQGPGQAPPPPLPVPRMAALQRKAKITVDGSLADWPSLPPMLLDDPRQVSETQLEAFRDPKDLAARAFLLWDAEDLYFSAVVSDDWHRELEEKAPRLTEIPACDSIVLTFDPDRDTRSLGADDGRKEDREFWLGSIRGGEQKLVIWDRFRGTARFAEGALAISRDKERGLTTYEARIPWKEILPPGRSPTLGQVLRLQVVVNDYDEVTDTMPQTRVGWTFGSFVERIDPGVFGSIILLSELSESDPRLPDFPPGPKLKGDPVPGPAYWVDLFGRLTKHPAKVFSPGLGDPSSIAGPERRSVLEDLDHQIALFPRVDWIEYLQRVDRRMRRESAGICATGMPFGWQYSLDAIARDISAKPPVRPRITRLPQGGFLIRGGPVCFAIDPCGNDVEKVLFPACDFVLLTDANDIGRRNDQLLLRMLSAKKRVFMHLAVHLPSIPADKMDLCQPGKTYEFGGLKVEVLGLLTDKGQVSAQVGYFVTWPDGTSLAVAPPIFGEEYMPKGRPPCALILSALHPRARVVGQRIAADLTILGDILVPPVAPGPAARVGLDGAYSLQEKLLPNRSILLAPGESVDIPQRR